MTDTVEKRVSELEHDVEQILGRLPGAPLSIRLQALEARIREGRITTETEIAKIEANIAEILQRLPKAP